MVNSLDVADVFGNEHASVLETIGNFMSPGRKFRSFDMTRDAFTPLVIGWTGDLRSAVPEVSRDEQ